MSKTNLITAGIDPGYAGCGLAIGSADSLVVRTLADEPAAVYEPHADACYNRTVRWEGLVAELMFEIESRDVQAVLLEGYSFKSNSPRAQFNAEVRGLLLFHLIDLVDRDVLVAEVAPSCLKKFAAGHGNASKPSVQSAIVKRWDIDVASDHEADAAACWWLGQVAVGALQPKNKKQTEAVSTVLARVGGQWHQPSGRCPSPNGDAAAAATPSRG